MHWHLLTVVLAVAVPAEDKKKDEELIQGTWTVVSREFVGKKTPEKELKAMKVTIKEGTITLDDGEKKEKHAYKLDPSKTPKAIDLANTGIEQKETTPAIYELDGDALKICWSEKDPDHRPTKFAGDEASGQTMIVLKREKKDEPKPSLEEVYRALHKGLTSEKKEEREKALKAVLPTKKDVETLFPKHAEKYWPLFEEENKYVLDHTDEIAKAIGKAKTIETVTARDVRQDKELTSGKYKRLLEMLPPDVGVYKYDIKTDYGGSGGETFFYRKGRWFWIKDAYALPEELDKIK
jgi:uncharacterized protein (TIGR03067 family)